MDPTEKATFRDLLRQYRRTAGLTQDELAERARLSTRAISDLERGARTRPWPETVALIADGLNLDPTERARLEVAARPVSAPSVGSASRPSGGDLSPRRDNLPVELTSFVGREREVADVTQLLGTTRLLTLTGAGGCGKTRLALRVAADRVDQYPDGVWLVELAPLADPSLVPATVSSAVGIQESRNQSVLTTLLAFLRARRLLLILDNCEHLIDACARLADEILRGGPDAKILATSREPLGIRGEVSWRVPSLAVPLADPPLSLAALTANEAMRLFGDRAVAAQPAFVLTEQNAPVVARICRRLDGIPLAIELAATRVRSLPVEQIDARLDQRFRLLTGGSRAALPRQQTLVALVGWSYDLLSVEEQTVFNRLSVFSGGFTLEAAETVCSWEGGNWKRTYSVPQSPPPSPEPPLDVLDRLGSLVDKSLVIAEGAGGSVERYRLSETLREYGRERLREWGEEARAREHHARFYLDLVEDCVRAYTSNGPAPTSWDARLVAEMANLRAALAWYRDNDSTRGLRLAAGLGWFWILRRDVGEGESWFELFLAREPSDTGVRGRALLALATLKRDRGLIDAAQPVFEEGLALCRQVGDQWGIARCLIQLANQARSAGEFDHAITLAEESLTLARKIRSEESIFWGIGSLAQFYRLSGQIDRSRALAEEVARLDPNGHDPIYQLGLIAEAEGEYGRAADLYQYGIDRRLVTEGWNWWRVLLSGVARKRGDREQAHRLLEDDLVLARREGSRVRIPWILLDLAELERSADNPAGGRSWLAEGLDLASRDGNQQRLAHGFFIGARRAFDGGDRIRAARLFGAADAALPGFRFEDDGFEISAYQTVLGQLRAALSLDAFAAAWGEGRGMTTDEAIALALAEGDGA